VFAAASQFVELLRFIFIYFFYQIVHAVAYNKREKKKQPGSG